MRKAKQISASPIKPAALAALALLSVPTAFAGAAPAEPLPTTISADLSSSITHAAQVSEQQTSTRAAVTQAVTRPGDGRVRSASASPVVSLARPTVAINITSGPKAPVNTAASSSSNNDLELLAQLDAELGQTEAQLTSTSKKLSAGQQQLLSLSNTLESVMKAGGSNAVGLHPFVRIASRYAGTPYVWGGASRNGFDCSGFIIRVMSDLGYKTLPHSAAEQFKYGKPVAQTLLKPGDLVFFANTYKPGISHVGIYIGKRRFIHAASTKQGTIISSLDASPYKQKYAGARRLTQIKS